MSHSSMAALFQKTDGDSNCLLSKLAAFTAANMRFKAVGGEDKEKAEREREGNIISACENCALNMQAVNRP